MKALYLILAVIFLIFAILQLNDPDPLLWIPIYGYACILFVLAFFGYPAKILTLAGIAGYLTGIVIMIPDLIRWFRMGAPPIAGSMHAETPYIELTREFFGLAICLLAMLFLFFRRRKIRQ
jgi:hypothetical protein